MISLHNCEDLNQFGIRPLTGEACRVGRRILCDLTDDGRKIVADLLGIENNQHVFAGPWNGRGATASFMLPYTLLMDLFVWCLIHKGCIDIAVIHPGEARGLSWVGEVIGLERGASPQDWELWNSNLEFMKEIGKSVRRICVHTNQPGEGTRCTHAMSGRTI